MTIPKQKRGKMTINELVQQLCSTVVLVLKTITLDDITGKMGSRGDKQQLTTGQCLTTGQREFPD